MFFLRQILESFRFAWQALRSNLLRTLLSLLGVTIGIFAIIAVFTLVDSLERSVKTSLSFVGDKVVYLSKWPWSFGGEYQWWKYFQRPETKYSEFRYLNEQLESAQAMAILDFKRTVVKYGNSSTSSQIQGTTYDYNRISDVPIASGRYFTPQEMAVGRPVTIIGATVAEDLFNGQEAVGKTIKIGGTNFLVIGVQLAKGKSLVSVGGNQPDIKCIIPYLIFSKLFNSGVPTFDIAIKGYANDDGLLELESEIQGLLRARRGLRPTQDDNFAVNRPEAAVKFVSAIFTVLTLAGWVIGGFSILIGGFGIANIMFVSVKERTNIIGIQKSLGAKNYVILFQFLFESILLSLVGGLGGILLVYLLSLIPFGSLELQLTLSNIVLGLGVSSVIGVLSGIIPAFSASRLDPVIAIRAK